MAGNRISLNFEFVHELRTLYQMTAVRLEELNFLDPAEYKRVSAAITAAVNSAVPGCVEVDVPSTTVRVGINGIANAIGEAFTAAGVRPDFLKPVYRPEGLGWFRHTGWRVAVDSGIARSFPHEGCWSAAGGVVG